MKIPVIITTILIAQVSASFFDVFQGAVLSVQNSFGKLLSDVVTDVRDTVDCTILAVEHVLSLSDDASARYYDKCGGGKNKTGSGGGVQQDGNYPKVEVSLQFPNNEEYLKKEIPAEINVRINETLSKVVGSYNPQDNLRSVETVLAKESKKIADVSDLVNQELDKLSNEVNSDFKIMKQKDSEPSVDKILQEIKLLEHREQNTKNVSEANKIHEIIDDVLGKLDAIEATEANENIKLEEILKDLENNSNNSFIDLRNQFEDWKKEEGRHLGEIKNKMEEHERSAELPGYSYNSHKLNHTHTGQLNTIMTKDDIKPPKINGLSSLHTDAEVEQEPNNDDSNSNPPTNITSSDKGNTICEPTLNSQEITNKELSTQIQEILDSTTTLRPVENRNKESLLTTAPTPFTLTNDALNDTLITSASFSVTESTFVSEITLPCESTATENAKPSTSSTNRPTTVQNEVNEDDSYDTLMSPTFPNTENNAPVDDTIQPVKTITDSEEQESLITNKPTTILKLTYENDSHETRPMSEIILPVETNTGLGKDESSIVPMEELTTLKINSVNDSNDTVITSTSSPVIFSTFGPVSETIQPVEIPTDSGNDEASTETINELATTEILVNDNESSDIITSTPSQIIDITPGSETIQPVETITVSTKEESSTLTTDKPINATNTADSDSNAITITSPSVSTLESITDVNQPVENTTTAENEETSTMTIHSPGYNTPGTLIDNDSNETIITSTSSPTPESKLVSEIIQPVENNTATEDEEPLSTNQPVTITEKVSNDDNDSNDTVTGTDSASVNETIQPIEITMDSGKQELSPTSTQYTLNDTVTTSTTFTPKEIIPASETILPVTSTPLLTNEENTNLTKLLTEKKMSTPKILSHNVNDIITKSPLLTESPRNVNTKFPLIDRPIIPVNREWLTPNKFNQQNYNKNGPGNYDSYSPQSIRDRTLKREQPLINRKGSYDSHAPIRYRKTAMPANNSNQRRYNTNPANPNYYDTSESVDPIRKRNLETEIPLTKGAFNGISTIPANSDPKISAPDIAIEREKQREKAAFDSLESMIAQHFGTDWPFAVPDLNPKVADVTTTPVTQKTYAPRRPINRLRMNYESSPHIQTPKNRTRPPYSFDGSSANTDKPPRGLTTYRPMHTAARGVNNHKNAPSDYDSFFQPQKNTTAHERALREARQLMAHSKRSDRIINNIMKNKKSYGARSIFNNPGTLNSGK